MASPRLVSKVKVLTVDKALPEPGQAAALALTLLRLTKADTWQELADKVSQRDPAVHKALSVIYLDPDQLRLLQEYPAAVSQVAHGAPRRTIALCDLCGEHVTVAKKSPPSKCVMTLLCEGTYTKVAPAKAHQVPASDVGAGSDDADHQQAAEEVDGLGAEDPGQDDAPPGTSGQGDQDEELGEDEEAFEFD